MGRTAANTGIMPTALAAIERNFPEAQRIIDDSLAVRMLPFAGRVSFHVLRPRRLSERLIGHSKKGNPGIWAGLLCRKRYIGHSFFVGRRAAG